MPTSSIFHSIELKTSEEVERFLRALEESEEAVSKVVNKPQFEPVTNHEEIRKLIEKSRGKRAKPLDYSTLSKEQIDCEIEKGVKDVREGRVYSIDTVENEMKKEFGV